jgi:hypothetical protein
MGMSAAISSAVVSTMVCLDVPSSMIVLRYMPKAHTPWLRWQLLFALLRWSMTLRLVP